MNNIRTHISISEKADNLVHTYMEKNNCKYSQAVSQLIEIGSNKITIEKVIRTNNSLLDKIYTKTYYITSLLEQVYSDFQWDDLTNPNNSKALNKFKTKFNKYKYDD